VIFVGTLDVLRPMEPMHLPRRRVVKSVSMRRRGAVMVEYTLLLTTVGVMFLAGITAAGRVMLTQYQEGRSWILLPIP
jgi:Flp pilus assembly pilin Flp